MGNLIEEGVGVLIPPTWICLSLIISLSPFWLSVLALAQDLSVNIYLVLQLSKHIVFKMCLIDGEILQIQIFLGTQV